MNMNAAEQLSISDVAKAVQNTNRLLGVLVETIAAAASMDAALQYLDDTSGREQCRKFAVRHGLDAETIARKVKGQ